MSKKNTILHHATALFARQGFKGTSMAAVSRMSGVASATIFYHFENKESLLSAVLVRIKEVILNKFQRYEAKHHYKNGLLAVEGAVTYTLALASDMEDEFLLLHRHFPYEMAEINPINRNPLVAIYNCLVDILERAIETGQKDGSIGPVPAHKTALILFSMLDGIIRLHTYKLYDSVTLYQELLTCCGRILHVDDQRFEGNDACKSA